MAKDRSRVQPQQQHQALRRLSLRRQLGVPSVQSFHAQPGLEAQETIIRHAPPTTARRRPPPQPAGGLRRQQAAPPSRAPPQPPAPRVQRRQQAAPPRAPIRQQTSSSLFREFRQEWHPQAPLPHLRRLREPQTPSPLVQSRTRQPAKEPPRPPRPPPPPPIHKPAARPPPQYHEVQQAPPPQYQEVRAFQSFGPVRDRKCTDVPFLILFIAFLAYLGYILYNASMMGDPRRLLYGYDSYGNICGYKNEPIKGVSESGKDMTDKPYLYIPFKVSNLFFAVHERRCVSECPTWGVDLPLTDTEVATKSPRVLPTAQPQQNGTNQTANETAPYSEPALLNQCFPAIRMPKIVQQALNITQSFIQEVAEDFASSWKEMVYIFFIALGLSVMLLVVFRFFAGLIIWSVLLVISTGCILLTLYIWYQWNLQKEYLEGLASNITVHEREDEEFKQNLWLAGAITCLVFTVALLLVIIVMRTRIQLVAILFKEAAKVLGDIPGLLVQPIWTFALLCATCVGWCIGFAYLHTAEIMTIDSHGHVIYRRRKYYWCIMWYHIFALFWVLRFIIGCQHLVIAGAVAKWFFTRNKSELSSPIARSIWNLAVFHLGSVALGSLILAVVQIIRYVLHKLQRLAHHYSETLSWLLKVCACCFWCFERWLKFLNRNAYIEIAIYGKSFCTSGRQAFIRLASNALRVAAINSVGDFMLFMGKLMVTISMGIIGYHLMKTNDTLKHLWVLVLISCLLGFLISHCFMSIYEMVIDTLFLCFCEDCEKNNGYDKPYFMSRNLMEFVSKSEKVAPGTGMIINQPSRETIASFQKY